MQVPPVRRLVGELQLGVAGERITFAGLPRGT